MTTGARGIRVKHRIGLGYLVVVFAALAGCGAKDPQTAKHNGATQSVQSLLKRLSEIAGQANGAAPANVDPDTRLDGARAGPGLKLTSTYTLLNSESDGVNSATFEAKLTPAIKKGGCENPALRPLIDQGVVVDLEYRGIQGNTIGIVSLTRDTCAALK
jgi:hypothetical protein